MVSTLTYMIETMGERVKRAREEADLTQQQLADAIGLTRGAVALWETGDSKAIKTENIFKAARALNKNPEWLATGDGPEQPAGSLREIIEALPTESGQQALDFIQYRIERSEEFIASDKVSRYTAMLDRFKRDLSRRKAQGEG